MKRIILSVLGVFALLLLINIIIGLLNTAWLAPWNTGPLTDEAPVKSFSGAVHVHSRNSDGSGWLETILAAGRQTDLDFILLTDHNTTALADSISGDEKPLTLIGSELSLQAGHLLLFGGPRIAEGFREQDYGGQRALLDSMENNQGFAIVAHPFHPKIAWKDTISERITGIELINADVEWRNDSPLELLRAIFSLPFFGHAMNSLLDFPTKELALLDRLAQKRPIAAIGSVDAHARIKLSKTAFWKFPSYEKNFRLVQTALVVPQYATADRATLLSALRAGHTIAGYAAFGDLRQVRVWMEDSTAVFPPGSKMTIGNGKVLRVLTPPGLPLRIRLYHNGIRIRESSSRDVRWQIDAPGAYRVAVIQMRRQFPFFSRTEIPWAFSSPFFIQP